MPGPGLVEGEEPEPELDTQEPVEEPESPPESAGSDVLMGYYKRNASGILPIVQVIVGPRGRGKSKLAVPLARSMVSDARQIVCAGFGTPQVANELGRPWHQLDATTPKNAAAAAEFFRTIYKSDNQFVLVLDDSDAAWSEPARFKALWEFIRNNRALGQGAIIICHSPGDVSKTILKNAQVVWFACQSEPNSIDYIRRYMKPDFPNAEARVRSLPAYTFLAWAPELPGTRKYVGEGWVDESGNIQIAERWNSPSPSPSPTDTPSPPPDPGASAGTAPPRSEASVGPTPAKRATASGGTGGRRSTGAE